MWVGKVRHIDNSQGQNKGQMAKVVIEVMEGGSKVRRSEYKCSLTFTFSRKVA